jgi:hypothetical protein
VLFGAPGRRETVSELARLRGVPCVHLPTDRASLTDAIQAAIAHAMSAGAWSIAAAVVTGALALTRLAIAI